MTKRNLNKGVAYEIPTDLATPWYCPSIYDHVGATASTSVRPVGYVYG